MPTPPVTMPTNPAPGKRNARHIGDQAVTVPTKTSIPICTFDDVFNRRFNDGQQPRPSPPQGPFPVGSTCFDHQAGQPTRTDGTFGCGVVR